MSMSHRKLRSCLFLTAFFVFAGSPVVAQESVLQPRQETAVTTVDHRVPSGYFMETQVRCPNSMDIRVSGPPGGWEPSVSRVRSENPEAAVEQTGGETRLVCRYLDDDNYYYYRSAPDGESRCRVISSAIFGCRRPGDWINDIGSTALTGQINFDNRFDQVVSDFRIIAVAEENERYVSSTNESARSLAAASGAELSRNSCSAQLDASGANRVPLRSFTAGSRWCFETQSGRIGWLEVTTVNRGVPRVDYTTWAH